ncbi:hypothetical protein XBJ2_150002 [Xenorhabdus bovienii str. Jollieti]|uniref:Uncharacterized protein n=1 Tax=Xenorhabdus bovienii (strain SS-2004) TaxID=406818 RepID=D3UWA4_XENBS|nr:hypothetical protein XBJ1_0464 [Xenorhabdus bovienii SS-2004]CDH27745.1 hypothetical protein XBJ2_150002 [Xenorhabdus bovienii str. Jollieti]
MKSILAEKSEARNGFYYQFKKRRFYFFRCFNDFFMTKRLF